MCENAKENQKTPTASDKDETWERTELGCMYEKKKKEAISRRRGDVCVCVCVCVWMHIHTHIRALGLAFDGHNELDTHPREKLEENGKEEHSQHIDPEHRRIQTQTVQEDLSRGVGTKVLHLHLTIRIHYRHRERTLVVGTEEF
jgi:hypothetical protein